MNKLLIAVVACVAVMFSCKGDKTAGKEGEVLADTADTIKENPDSVEEAIMESPVPKTVDELFDDFFFNFIVNRKMQYSRIHFPLAEKRDGKTVMIERRQWKMDHFFMNQGYYTLIFDNKRQLGLLKDTSINHVVVEKIYLNRRRVKQYVFEREHGLWMLNAIVHKGTYATMNASFLEFYRRFANDTTFQLKSLNDPVTFTGPDPDDDFKQMSGVITPDTWLAFSPEMPVKMIYNIIYGQNYTESNRKVFLIRGIANGLEIEMVFRRTRGKWMLTSLAT